MKVVPCVTETMFGEIVFGSRFENADRAKGEKDEDLESSEVIGWEDCPWYL